MHAGFDPAAVAFVEAPSVKCRAVGMARCLPICAPSPDA